MDTLAYLRGRANRTAMLALPEAQALNLEEDQFSTSPRVWSSSSRPQVGSFSPFGSKKNLFPSEPEIGNPPIIFQFPPRPTSLRSYLYPRFSPTFDSEALRPAKPCLAATSPLAYPPRFLTAQIYPSLEQGTNDGVSGVGDRPLNNEEVKSGTISGG